LAVFSALALADDFSGKLVDATCISQNKGAPCDPTPTTAAFALMTADKVYALDEAGNAKAVEALKNRADRSTDPSKPAPAVTAKVVGSKEPGNILKVTSIEIR
jgi:hypothetical protein